LVLLLEFITMHGHLNVKFVAQSAGGSLTRAVELDTPNVCYNIDTVQSITVHQRR